MASVEFHNLWSFENQKHVDIPLSKCGRCQETQLTSSGKNIFCPKCKFTLEGNYCTEVVVKENACCKGKDNDIVAYCFNCCINLCHSCFTEHQYMKFFEDHHIFNFTNQCQDENFPVCSNQLICCLHKTEILRYFCKTCSTLICEKCAASDHPKEIHDYEFVEDDLKLKIKEEIIKRGEAKMNELKNMGKLVDDQCSQLQEQYHKVQAEIKDVFCFFYNVIQDRKEQLLKELEHLYNKGMLPLRIVSSQINEVFQNTQMPSTVNFNQEVTFPDTTGFSNVGSNMVSFLDSTSSNELTESARKIAAESIDLEFHSNYQAIEVSVRNTFGFINPKCGGSSSVKFDGCTNDIVKSINGLKLNSDTVPRFSEISNCGLNFDVANKKLNGRSSSLTINDPKPFAMPTVNSLQTDLKNLLTFNISKYYLKRKKMIYYNKIGDFGVHEGCFAEPSGVAVNSRNEILVADTNNHRIQIFDEDGRFKFKFGEAGKNEGQFFFPNRVAVSPKSGDIVITERNPTHQVQVYNQYGQFVRKFGADVLQHPRGVTIDMDELVIIVECKVMKVVIFDIYGNLLKKFGCSKYVEFPNGVAVNDKQEIFISDNRAHCVKVFSYEGIYIRQIGGEGLTNYPISVCINKSGEVLIADNHSSFNLTIFTQSGELIKGLESKAKHVQCFDTALIDHGSIVLASKDFRLYLYRYNI